LDADVHYPEPIVGGQGLEEFDDQGRMHLSAYYNRLVDVMEELVKFTLLLREDSAAEAPETVAETL